MSLSPVERPLSPIREPDPRRRPGIAPPSMKPGESDLRTSVSHVAGRSSATRGESLVGCVASAVGPDPRRRSRSRCLAIVKRTQRRRWAHAAGTASGAGLYRLLLGACWLRWTSSTMAPHCVRRPRLATGRPGMIDSGLRAAPRDFHHGLLALVSPDQGVHDLLRKMPTAVGSTCRRDLWRSRP